MFQKNCLFRAPKNLVFLQTLLNSPVISSPYICRRLQVRRRTSTETLNSKGSWDGANLHIQTLSPLFDVLMQNLHSSHSACGCSGFCMTLAVLIAASQNRTKANPTAGCLSAADSIQSRPSRTRRRSRSSPSLSLPSGRFEHSNNIERKTFFFCPPPSALKTLLSL